MSFFDDKKNSNLLSDIARSEYLDLIQPKRLLHRMWALNVTNFQKDLVAADDKILNLILASCANLGERAKLFEDRAIGIVKAFELLYPGEISDDSLIIYTKSSLLGLYAGIFENTFGVSKQNKIHPQIWNALILYVRQLEDKYSEILASNKSNDLLDLINYVGYCVGRSPDLHIGRAIKDL